MVDIPLPLDPGPYYIRMRRLRCDFLPPYVLRSCIVTVNGKLQLPVGGLDGLLGVPRSINMDWSRPRRESVPYVGCSVQFLAM